ncbi:MAG TPA: DUF4835 family protein, partial [Emticicia sp.]
MNRFFKVFLLFLFFHNSLLGQDLNARVQLLSPQIENNNKRLLNVLEGSIKDFLNGRKWSSDKFLPQEKISCTITINIVEWDGSSNFKAEAQIQSSRPVYGTTYQSTILNISDKEFNFNYSEGQQLDYSDQNFSNNLSSLLAYYAYVILGMDYDSFSRLDGTDYFAKAQTVVNNAQNTAFAGWKAFEGLRNRYWLVENLNNKAYSPIREALYTYHRKGLDVMQEDQMEGRKKVLETLFELKA